MKETGRDGFTIPDHEVITRRKQFRLKKDRAEEKQKKKDAKKMAKEQKQSEKENAVKKNKGRSAAEKVEGRKSNKAKVKAKAGEVAASDDDVKPSPSATRSRGLKRLRKMKSAKANSFEAVPAAIGAPESKNEDTETNQEVKSQGKKKKQKKTKKEKESPEKPAPKPKPKSKKPEDLLPDGQGSKSNKKRKAPKTKEEADDDDTKGSRKPRKESAAKAKAKGKAKAAPKSRASGQRRGEAPVPVDAALKDSVFGILQECKKTHCQHPTFQRSRVKKALDLCIYWSRKSVGIKAERNLLPNRKAQGKGKAQVQYFSCETPCAYTNIYLAEQWVSRLQPRVCLKRHGSCHVWLGQ